MSESSIGVEEIQAALKLPKTISIKIEGYEKQHWAANPKNKELNATWREFEKRLESLLKNSERKEQDFIDIVFYLSTIDTVRLLTVIGRTSPEKQSRFLYLLNWLIENSTTDEVKRNVNLVRERILMTYRMVKYPQVYAKERIEKAIRLLG